MTFEIIGHSEGIDGVSLDSFKVFEISPSPAVGDHQEAQIMVSTT